MSELPDIGVAIRKLFDSYGGKEKFFEATKKRLAEFNMRWDQDIGAMGRVLRSHLIVEHYMTAYLQKVNPNLGVIDEARIGFAQKVDLLGDHDILITELIPGIRRVNTVRNRLAHNLSVSVTQDDVNSFSSIGIYWAMRKESEKRSPKFGAEPLDIYDHFSQFSASIFHHASSDESAYWRDSFSVERE